MQLMMLITKITKQLLEDVESMFRWLASFRLERQIKLMQLHETSQRQSALCHYGRNKSSLAPHRILLIV